MKDLVVNSMLNDVFFSGISSLWHENCKAHFRKIQVPTEPDKSMTEQDKS